MTLARVVEIKRYAGVCAVHPHWAIPATFSYEHAVDLVREHNDAEHEGAETLD